jgi:hypothetical protein
MVDDQINKMKKANHSESLFLLSWTLTQSDCELLIGDIRISANQANAELCKNLLPVISQNCYPNIIYIDNIVDNIAAFAAMMVNLIRYRNQFLSLAYEQAIVQSEADIADTEKYIESVVFICAASIDEARHQCPAGFTLYENIVCNNREGKPVFIGYRKTSDVNLAMKTIDGANNPAGKTGKLPIKEIGVADKGKIPPDWEAFASVSSFVKDHKHDCYIIVKR